jgi:nitrite reductase (NADH) small subunit
MASRELSIMFVRVCPASELPREGEVAEFTVNGRALCVARVEGAITVLESVCPHEGGPLGEGTIEGGRVVCPWHGYAYDVTSGACLDDPNLRAQVFDAKIEDGELRVIL